MKKICIWLVIVAVCINYVSTAAPEMTCKEFVAGLTKRQVGGIGSCSKSMKFKNAKEKASKMNCILKCVMQKEGILNADGTFDKAAGQKMLDTEIPPSLMTKMEPIMDKCVTAAVTIDPKEELCKTYDPVIKCFLDMLGNICK